LSGWLIYNKGSSSSKDEVQDFLYSTFPLFGGAIGITIQIRPGSLVSLMIALMLSGCGPEKRVTALTDRYLRLAVALGERDPDSLDFYVGPESLISEIRKNPPKLEEIANEARVLEQELPNSHMDQTRMVSLRAQLRAMEMRVKSLEGKTTTFDAESNAYFGVVAPEDSGAKERVGIRAEIARLIGPGAAKYSAYEARFVVPPQKVPSVMETALKVCRDRTLQRVPMPQGEKVEVRYVLHKPWSAFSRYMGNARSVIEVNAEFPLTVDRILDLACHEGYPGHHVFNTLRDQVVVKRMGRREGMVQLTFSPQSYVSEAAASYAPEMIFDEGERAQVEKDVLFPIAGVDAKDVVRYVHIERLIAKLHSAYPGIAREYIDGRLEFVRAADALEQETLMEHGETMLLYLNEYRSYMLTYTLGRDAVAQRIDGKKRSQDDRWERYLALMREPVISLASGNWILDGEMDSALGSSQLAFPKHH
jgi:hypothetical protein